MSDSVITVEKLGKRYRIHHQQQGGMRYKALRDVLADAGKSVVRGPWSLTRRLWSAVRSPSTLSSLPSSRSASEDFWALKDVSFEVKQGETLGIIGRNGAGKSTLLKILSRITEPTEGRVRIKGRVASLLEVGTGFHPELTGRENIFLNGAILGMHRAEIKKKFDEIVDFAEVEKFLDTPVKRYSSGMYVRLAFAVAAHLEPEILIVDEVLAVGDAEFQKKCLGKMQDVSSKEGRTVLFVSHNMQAVSTLCTAAIVLRNGEITDRGLPRTLIAGYLSFGSHDSAEAVWTFETAPSSALVKLHSVKVCQSDGTVSYDQRCGSPVTLTMEFWCLRKTKMVPSFHLYNQSGLMVFPTGPLHVKELGQKIYEPGLYHCSCVIPEALLNTGIYFVHAWLSRETDGQAYVHIPEVVSFKVINDGTGMGDSWTGDDNWPGVIRPLLLWTSKRLDDLPG
jgi:lipopolysaccharide transport system ATP-binding protein